MNKRNIHTADKSYLAAVIHKPCYSTYKEGTLMFFKEKACYIAIFVKIRNKTVYNSKVNVRKIFCHLYKGIGKHKAYSIDKVIPLLSKNTQQLFPVLASCLRFEIFHLYFGTEIHIIRIVLNIALILLSYMNQTCMGRIVKRFIAPAANIKYQSDFIFWTGSLALFLCSSSKN